MTYEVFEEFPPETLCPICKTNENRPCVLVPIKGTEQGHVVEADPTHVECLVEFYNGWKENQKAVNIAF